MGAYYAETRHFDGGLYTRGAYTNGGLYTRLYSTPDLRSLLIYSNSDTFSHTYLYSHDFVFPITTFSFTDPSQIFEITPLVEVKLKRPKNFQTPAVIFEILHSGNCLNIKYPSFSYVNYIPCF